MTETTSEHGKNSDLTEAEKQALLLRGLSELQEMIEEKNAIVADIRNHRKRIVSYGFEPFEIDYALKLRKEPDADMIARRRAEARIARFMNHPIGTEPDMFDEVDRTPAVDRAFDEGKIAGAAGKSASPPYDPGVPQHQAWLKGWHQAQETLAAAFKKLPQDETEDA